MAYESKPIPSEPGKPRGRFPPYGSRVFEEMEASCLKTVVGFLKEHGFQALPAPGIPIKPAAVAPDWVAMANTA
ncbi:MAG: hypothetical protein GX493_03145 [Firmicutes bacterium]|nr:hypothetical protein [Bacillota bacterium]